MAVLLADEQDVSVDDEALLALARFVLTQRRVPDDMELTVVLVDEPTIAQLNAQHLDGDGPTDVLAFPIDEPGEVVGDAPAILGDVVLCPAYIRRQAEDNGTTFARELSMLTVHGILHLLGMDHAEPDEAAAMFALTDELLADFQATNA
ncbi:MAG: rRNA maturation RNase YbeY [Nitriliruptoraceae bacterium]